MRPCIHDRRKCLDKPEPANEAVSSELFGYAQEALLTIKEFNQIRNDTESYLYQVALWGLGAITIKPNPEDYGI